MSTFLELAQKVARKSGTVQDGEPTAVTGLTGRLKKVADMTAEAWRDIQRYRREWLWMRKEFSGNTSAAIAEYAPASFGITDHSRWITGPDMVWLSDTALGFADEGALREVAWNVFLAKWKRGAHDNNRPVEYAIAPNKRIHFGPTPDKDYTVRGEYVRSVQELAANDDVPEMPEEYHDLVVWRALFLLTGHDEAVWQHSDVGREYSTMMGDLAADQLPVIHDGAGPLA